MSPIIQIEVSEGEIKKTLNELTEAQETIRRCYFKLRSLGVLRITEEATSES